MKRLSTFVVLTGVLLSSCKKEGCTNPDATNYNPDAKKDDGTCIVKENTDDHYSVPESYNFENVDYSGQTTRIKLLHELASSISPVSNSNVVTASSLADIYENTNELFGSSKNLKSKTFATDVTYFENIFTDIETHSSAGTGLEMGGRYFSPDGVEFEELVEKGLMGAVFYYQATSIYLNEIELDENTHVEPGKGTEMEHHFDEAFGYLGVPKDYSTNETTEGDFETSSWYWGKYLLSRNAVLNNKETLFNAFLKGRTAISNDDMSTLSEQVNIIKTEWEKLVAANVVHYINSVNEDLSTGDTASWYHHWSEAKAFALCLKYNTSKIISDTDWQRIYDGLGNYPAAAGASDLDDILVDLQTVYGFTDSQMLNL